MRRKYQYRDHAFATGFALLLLASPAFAVRTDSRGGQTDNTYSVDYPAGSRWEPCRTCYLTVTGFIDAVNKPSKYTANEDAEPAQPNDMPEFDMIRKFDSHVMPALARWYESQFMVVRTNEPLNASAVLPDKPGYRQYRNQVFNNCDLLLVSKWKENHHCTGGGRSQDKYGRANVVVQTCGPNNLGWEYAEMTPKNKYVNTDMEYMGSMSVSWHEFNHGMFGGFGISKSDTRSWFLNGQGMGSHHLDNVIRTPPDHWPRPSFVQHFMKNLPAGTRADLAKPFEGGQGLYYVNSPRVLEMARYWTNCPTLKGYPLKNDKGGRSEYLFGHHGNFGGNWGDVNCYGRNAMVSAMSYALYEDSGLWKINWTNVNFDNVNIAVRPNQNSTRLMTEHFKTGCGFFEEPWPFLRGDDDASSTVSSVNGKRYHEPTPGWSQFLCNRAAYGGTKAKTKRHYCSADRKSKAICGRRADVDMFQEGGWGWAEGGGGWESELENPFRATRVVVPTDRLDGETKVEGSSATPGTCLDAGSQNSKKYFESASESSRCFRGTIEPEGETPWSNSFESAFCFEHRCTAGNLIEFRVNSVWYACPELGGKVKVAGFSGHVTCPHQMLICPANCPGQLADGRDCNGRGTCNRRTGICMCHETLVNSSYVGIGCEQEWKTYWPSKYPYDGLFKPLDIKLRDLPHFDASDNLAIIAAVRAALGVKEGDVELDVSSFRFEVESEHLLPGVTKAEFDAKANNANAYLRYRFYEGMIVGRLNKDSEVSGDLGVDDVKVGEPRAQARRRLLSGYVVPFTVYPPTIFGAASAQEIKARCANPATFSNIADTFGGLAIASPPVMSATITVTVGATDPDAIAKVNAAVADRGAFDAKVQREAESRGMYSEGTAKKGLGLFLIVGIAAGGVVVVGLAAVAAYFFVKKKSGKVGQAPAGAKQEASAKATGKAKNKVAPTR